MKTPIASVEVTYLIHATEDGERVGRAVAALLSTAATPETEVLEGHFGNEIMKARLHLTGEEAARALRSAFSKLPKGVKEEVRADLPTLVDEHSALFFRLDKQSVVAGEPKLGTADPIRLKVKPRLFQLNEPATRMYSGLLGGD